MILKFKQMEKTIISPLIGMLAYDKEFDWYTGSYSDGKEKFDIYISKEGLDDNELQTLLGKVEALLKSRYYETALLEMETDMIKLKNKAWLGEEELEIAPEDFRKHITIDSITFYEDGNSEIHCNNNNIFRGHSIIIDTNENGTFEEATLAG